MWDPVLTWYIECLRKGYCAKKRQEPARQDAKICVHFERKGGIEGAVLPKDEASNE